MTEFQLLQRRCRDLVANGTLPSSTKCGGRGITREKLELLIFSLDGRLPAGVTPKYVVIPSLQTLPRELIVHEILSKLSPMEIYAYCSSNKASQKLCNDVSFWQQYLSGYDHAAIQALVLEAARANNLALIRMLWDHQKELDLIIDDRTLAYAYYLFRERKNVLAIDYIKNNAPNSYIALRLMIKNKITAEMIDGFMGKITERLGGYTTLDDQPYILDTIGELGQ